MIMVWEITVFWSSMLAGTILEKFWRYWCVLLPPGIYDSATIAVSASIVFPMNQKFPPKPSVGRG